MNSRGVVLLRSCLAVAPVIACLLSLSHRNSSRGGGGVARLIDGGEDVVHAVSGAVGSALSITLLYPLETVRTRLQVGACRSSGTENDNARRSSFRLVRDIGEAEGLVGLYRGWSSLVVALMALNFVYFYCFRSTRRWIVNMSEWGGSDGDEGGGGSINVDLVAGYLAGVIAVLVTGPLWLVNTRLKLQGVSMGRDGTTTIGSKQGEGRQYTGMLDCLRNVSNDEGICALWQGTFTSIILALNPAIQLGVYEALKRHRMIFGGSLGPFVNSFLAKLIATVVTYPIQVLQTRRRAGIQKDKMTASRLFRGFEAKLLQTCLNSGIMFVAYERLVGLLTIMTTSNDNATFRGV